MRCRSVASGREVSSRCAAFSLRARSTSINAHSSTDGWLVALACALAVPAAAAGADPAHLGAGAARCADAMAVHASATAEIVTTGETIRTQLIRDIGVAPSRVSSIPTGIDPERFAPSDRDDARRSLGLPAVVPLIGIVATLRSWKGHRILVEAMTLLAHRDAQLVIVGDGPQRDGDSCPDRRAGARLFARTARRKPKRCRPLACRRFDVFALPSYANEGVPQALLQAMLTALPCVTTDAGAIGEAAIADHTAVVVAKENAVALAAGIDRAPRRRGTGAAHRPRREASGR